MKKLGFGLMRLPHPEDDHQAIDKEKTKKLIDRYMKEGFSYFDTAYIYNHGDSERVFGELVAARYPRDSFVLTTKLPVIDLNSTEAFERVFNEELANCRVDYFDYYFLHALGKPLYEKVQRLKAFEFIARKKAEGRIKHIGFSFHDDAETLDRILTDHPEVELVQLQINYVDWKNETIQARKCYEVCVKHGKAVSVMEPLKGGALVNVHPDVKKLLTEYNPEASIASWGIRFAASQPNVMVVLSGMNSMDQLEDNMSYMKDFQPLTEEEYKILDKASKIISSTTAIPCTACRYCVNGCPKHIPIPQYFALYNNVEAFGYQGAAMNIYSHLADQFAKPTECIKCRQCERHCPQHLPILDNLKRVSKRLCWWEYDKDLFNEWIKGIPEEYDKMQLVDYRIHGHDLKILVAVDDAVTRFYYRYLAFGDVQLVSGTIADGKVSIEVDISGGYGTPDSQPIFDAAKMDRWVSVR